MKTAILTLIFLASGYCYGQCNTKPQDSISFTTIGPGKASSNMYLNFVTCDVTPYALLRIEQFGNLSYPLGMPLSTSDTIYIVAGDTLRLPILQVVTPRTVYSLMKDYILKPAPEITQATEIYFSFGYELFKWEITEKMRESLLKDYATVAP